MPVVFDGPLLNVNDELRLAIAIESSMHRLFRELVTDETILSEDGRPDTSLTTIGTVSEVFGVMMGPLLEGTTIPLVPCVIVGGALAGRVGSPSVGIGISGALSLSSGEGVLSRFDTSTLGAK